jgi:DNA-binding MarR family transcriptional regulator
MAAQEPLSGHEVDAAMRDVLTLAALTRVELAARLELPLRDVEAMEHVMLSDEGLGPVELGRRLGVTSAAATQGVHRLEAGGHLRRDPHPEDRRRQRLAATPAGAAHVMSELGPLLGMLFGVSDGFTSAELDVVTRYLLATADAYRRFLEP